MRLAAIAVVVCARVALPQVEPLPLQAQSGRVLAEGRAAVGIGGTVRAREAALRNAYADAVGRIAGTEIGSMTIIRNASSVADLVTARTHGMVRQYDVISEGLVSDDPSTYRVRIQAEVVTPEEGSPDARASLRLYVGLLGSPRVVILLAEEGDGPPGETEPGKLRNMEAALAHELISCGYAVTTSDELREGAPPEAYRRATRGVTADAVALARNADADLAIIGTIRTSERTITPEGVRFESVTGVISAKAVIVSSGQVVDAYHQSFTRAHTDALAAKAAVMNDGARGFADALAWSIPQILAGNPRETELRLRGFSEADRLAFESRLSQAPDVVGLERRASTDRAAPTQLILRTSFVRPDNHELVQTCRDIGVPCAVETAEKYSITLNRQ